MQTKLGVFCDKIIEAGWLVAVVVVPLFFNLYSHRIFEPDKVTLLRSIALVMILAWAVKTLDAGFQLLGSRYKGQDPRKGEPISNAWNPAFGNPLVIPVLVLAGVYIFTTITSIVPHLSLWGSYHRLQGTYTTLSYIAIFLLTLHSLRTQEQLDRLVTAILFTSLPVSLYGIIQHFGLDPIAWVVGEPVTFRATSTMGNSIFLAAYLIMVVPLTVGQLAQLFPSILSGEKKASPHIYILISCYALLLAAQLLCILFTQSLGPLLGLMGGILFFSLLSAALKGGKALALSIVGIAILLGLLLIFLYLPDTPLQPIQKMPYLGRFSGVFDAESVTGRQRLLAWEGTIDLITADPMRTVIGYGPESMIVAFPPYFPPDLVLWPPDATFDRAHNETLDALATTGFIGLAAFLFLFGSLFYHGLRCLGLVENHRHRNAFVFLWLVGMLTGVSFPWLLEGKLRLAGVGIPAGIIVALGAYLVICALLCPPKRETKDHRNRTILIALLSAVVAHFIEIQFGISIVATRTYFWVYTALIIIVGFFFQKEPTSGYVPTATFPTKASHKRRGRRWSKESQAPATPRQDSNAWDASLIPHSLLVGLILATMRFAFIGGQGNFAMQSLPMWGLFLTVWFICGAITIAKAREKLAPHADSILGNACLAYSLFSLGWLLMFVVMHISGAQLSSDVTGPFIVYCLYLFPTVVTIAILLLKRLTLPVLLWRRNNWWLYATLVLGATVFILTTNLNLIRADIYYNQGLAYANEGQWDRSTDLFRQALKLAPGQDFYYLFLAGAYVEKAKAAPEIAQRSTWLEEGRKALERARQINPLNPDHTAKLGLLYRAWGEMLADPDERDEKLNKALKYYQQAVALRPHNAKTFNEWGLVHYAKGEYKEAIEKYQQSLSLDRGSVQTYLLLGDAYGAIQDLDRAIEAYGKAVEIAPHDFTAHRNLALIYEQASQTDEAIAEAEIAKALAPANERLALGAFIAQLKARKP